MDIRPPFDAVADNQNGHHVVTVRDGDVTDVHSFASKEEAEKFRSDAYQRLKTKYSMMGK